MVVLAASPPGPLTRLNRGRVKYVLNVSTLQYGTGWIKYILSVSYTEKSSCLGRKTLLSPSSLKPTLQLLSAALAAI